MLSSLALLDVVLGYDCNLACSYCTITQSLRVRALSTERVVAELDRAASRGYDEVAFTGGEPTIRADLPALVRYARRRGYKHVKLTSNGLRYAHAAYLDHLVQAGVDRFHISMHARSDADYDETVRVEGAAVHRRRAIEHLVERRLDPVANLILKEDTYRALGPWVESLVEQGVRRFALWLVSLTDENAGKVEQLPRLTEVVPYLISTFEAARKGGHEVTSLHVPRCFVPGYEDHVDHPGGGVVTVVTPDDVFELKSSRLGGGVKPPGCSGCRYAADCPGLRADYIDVHGSDEVRAVR
jgi:cyclic pyranopterin phosphate synthase